MRKLAGRLLLLVLGLVFVCTPASAQGTYDEQLAAAKQEIGDIYQQWRQQQPNDPKTFEQFSIYMLTTRQKFHDFPVGLNYFQKKLVTVDRVLPNDIWVMGYFKTANSSHLIGFWVDINGREAPNLSASADQSQPADQKVFVIDPQGIVTVLE